MDTELISDDIRHFVALGIALAMAAVPVVTVSVMNMMDKVVRGQSRIGLVLQMIKPLV